MDMMSEREMEREISAALDAQRAEEQVEIMLAKLPGVSNYPWEGALNGHFYRIKRGVRVRVPRSIDELISENERICEESRNELNEYAKGAGKRLG